MRAEIVPRNKTEELMNTIRLLCPDLGFLKNPDSPNGNNLVVRGRNSDIVSLKKSLEILESGIKITIDPCETQAVVVY